MFTGKTEGKIEITEFQTWTKTYTLPGTHVFGMPTFKDSELKISSFLDNEYEFQTFVDVDMGIVTLKALLPI